MLFKQLSSEYLDDIAALEASAWPTPLRASSALIEQRLRWNHVMLGAFRKNHLVGITSWRYDHFDPANPMPENFDAFANRPNGPSYNAAFVYNFAITPALRNTKPGGALALSLISEGIKILIENRCIYLVGASRCPSYAGDNESPNRCHHAPQLQSAIEGYRTESILDRTLPWQQDPVLSFYKQALDCTFQQTLPGFMPEDRASGGYAIGFYKKLAK